MMASLAAETHQAVQRQWRVLLHDAEEMLLGVGIVHEGLRHLLLPPHLQMDGRGDDVLIGNADIGHTPSVVVEGADGLADRWGNGGDDHRASLGMKGLEAYLRLRFAIFICCRMHHVYLFLRAHTGDVSIVTNSYEQTAAVGVGEGRYGTRQFRSVLHLKFEVLLAMLPLGDKSQQVSLVVHKLKFYHKSTLISFILKTFCYLCP